MKYYFNILEFFYHKLNLKYTYDEKLYDKLIMEYHKKKSFSKPADRIIFMCDGKLYHGGLTDRLRGILTTFYIAKKLKKQFFINWYYPFPLDNYLIPKYYDWRIEPNRINYDERSSFPLVFNEYPPQEYKIRNYFSYLLFVKWLFKKRKDKHVYTNFYYPKKKFPLLYDELFKPTPFLSSQINFHLRILGKHYWSFSFRFQNLLGDFNDIINGEPLDSIEAEELINKNIQEFKSIIRDLPKGYKCFITSDSQIFLNKIKKIDHRIYIVSGQIFHIDLGKGTKEGWLKLFIDQNLIMRAEKVYLLKTGKMYKSGFAEFAALIGGTEYIYHPF